MGLNRRRIKIIPRIVSEDEINIVEKENEELKTITKEEIEEKETIKMEEGVKEIKTIEEIEEMDDLKLTPPRILEEEEKVEAIDEDDERVVCVNTGVVYADNKEASKMTGANASSIKKCCNGNAKSAGKDEEGNKLVWKYLKDM